MKLDKAVVSDISAISICQMLEARGKDIVKIHIEKDLPATNPIVAYMNSMEQNSNNPSLSMCGTGTYTCEI